MQPQYAVGAESPEYVTGWYGACREAPERRGLHRYGHHQGERVKKETWRVIVTKEIDGDNADELLKLVQLRDSLKEHGTVTTEKARPKREKGAG